MNEILKKLFETLVLFFNFLKWPYFIGYALLYNYGLNDNIALDILWFICGGFIAKDLYIRYKKEQAEKDSTKE